MSLRDHIYDLRYRLSLALLFIALGGIFGWIWWATAIGPVPSLSEIVMGPYCALPGGPGGVRVEFVAGQCDLLQTQPFEIFLLRLKVGLAVGAVLTSPGWLYQVWAFITPGLYAKERKFARTFVMCGSLLFAMGAALAYFVVPQGLQVLLSFGGPGIVTALAAGEYISFVLIMLVIFGVSFELPLLVVMLNRVGILPFDKLRRWRRGIYFGLVVFAAIVTPGTDPISMLALAVAMVLLFELSMQIARVHERRKSSRLRQEDIEFHGADDDTASPLDLNAEPEVSRPTPRSGLDDVT